MARVAAAIALGLLLLGADRTAPAQSSTSYLLTAGSALERGCFEPCECPLLIAEDHVVDPLSSRLIAQRVSSRDINERILDDSYHVATLDNDADLIFKESLAFIERLTTEGGR